MDTELIPFGAGREHRAYRYRGFYQMLTPLFHAAEPRGRAKLGLKLGPGAVRLGLGVGVGLG